MAVSSVQPPGGWRNGPPPTMSSRRGCASRGPELERRPHRVAHREAEEGPKRAVLDGVRAPGRNGGWPPQRTLATWASWASFSMAPGRTSRTRRIASSGRSPSSASRRAATVPARPRPPLQWTSTSKPEPQPVPDGLARHRPPPFEGGVRRLPVRYRRVPPLHVPPAHRLAEIGHLQVVDLPGGDQADHCGRSPVSNCVEVGVQVARPRPRDPVRIDLAGTQGDADPALAVPRGHRGDAEGAVLAGSCLHGMKRSGGRICRNPDLVPFDASGVAAGRGHERRSSAPFRVTAHQTGGDEALVVGMREDQQDAWRRHAAPMAGLDAGSRGRGRVGPDLSPRTRPCARRAQAPVRAYLSARPISW